MYEKFIQERINELRMKKNISEYQLSLDLGRSQGYILSITSGRNLPSPGALLDICDYFDITPSVFFSSHDQKSQPCKKHRHRYYKIIRQRLTASFHSS